MKGNDMGRRGNGMQKSLRHVALDTATDQPRRLPSKVEGEG